MAVSADLGLQVGTPVLGCLAPCYFLLPGLSTLQHRLCPCRFWLLHGGTVFLAIRSLGCAVLSSSLRWQLCMCWQLLKAGCLIPVRSGSLYRHAPCRLLVWLLGRLWCCLLRLGPVAATVSSIFAALGPGSRARPSHCCCCSTCVLPCRSGPALALPDPLF